MRINSVPRAAGAVTAIVLALTAMSCETSKTTGPTNRADVCKSFDGLGVQYMQGNGVFGNPLFKKAGELADIAKHYQGSPDLSADARMLKKIADSDSVTGQQFMAATESISDLCGHPFGLGRSS